MLCSLVFIKRQPRSAPPAPPRSSSPATGQTVCKLVMLRTPTDASIPFLFNHSATLRLRRRPTGSYVSPLFPCHCRRFPSQRTGTPPPLIFNVRPSPIPKSETPTGRRGSIQSRAPVSILHVPRVAACPPWRGSRAMALQPLCASQAQKERTNCALFRNKPCACHTCVFHGGEGYLAISGLQRTPREAMVESVPVEGSTP
jgi:hypothetical protein